MITASLDFIRRVPTDWPQQLFHPVDLSCDAQAAYIVVSDDFQVR